MKRCIGGLLAIVAACDSGGGGGGDDPPVDAMPQGVEYEPFTVRTRSFGLAGDIHQLSVTDATGPVACGLSEDHHNHLGTVGHQIIAHATPAVGTPCPSGSYAVRSNCATDLGFLPYVPEGCAYYRRFDTSGRLLGTVAATAGAITITGDEASCTIEMNLSFAGEAFTDTVTLTNGLVASPWCK